VQGERKFDLVVRLDDPFREDFTRLGRLALNLPAGGRIPIEDVATITKSSGPNTINRENVRRRIVVQCNVEKRTLSAVVTDIKKRLEPIQQSLQESHPGYYIEYGGQFETAQSATRVIGLLSLISLAAMFLALYTLFRSTNLSLQVLSALPMAAIGAVAALVITGQSLTVASMVGFISADFPLPAPREIRGRAVHSRNDRAGGQGTPRADAHDGPDRRHRPRPLDPRSRRTG
jgi:HME family heavy-metal exporter